MKVFKWILIGIVVVVAAAITYLTVFLDPNDFKPQIIAAVEKQTGRDFNIDKPLEWTFFPSVGIKAGGISLGNPKNFSQPTFAAINEVVATVELMPLFSHEVKIAELVLDGLRLNLVTDKQGNTSLDGLNSGKTSTAPATTEPTASTSDGGLTLKSLSIGGVSVTDAQVHVINEATGSDNLFTLDSFKIGALSLGEFASLDYELSAALDGLTVKSEGHGQLKISQDLKVFSLKELVLTTVAEGKSLPTGKVENNVTVDATVDTNKSTATTTLTDLAINDIKGKGQLDVQFGTAVPSVSAKLTLGEIDVDKWLPESSDDKTAAAPAPNSAAPATAAQEPDLTGLKAVNADFELAVAGINVSGLTTKDWKMVINLKNGVMNMKQLSAALYDGSLLASATLDGRNAVAKYSFDSQISSINIRNLLKDAADTEILDGTADIAIKGNGNSLIPDNIKQRLNADGKFAINNGALYGVNVPQMIRGAQAKLKGDFTETNNEAKKTDFTSLTGSFSLANGVANNPDLLMASPLIRISGQGDANLLDQSLDYKLTTALVSTLKGQGGKELDDLVGVEIPLAIKGSFTEPKFSLDTDALFKSKVKEEADKAKEKLTNKLFEKLGGKK
ncbi:AsmA family protein [Shewanella sp. A3A]|nr:AsmA family protein [Shewanella ferrihydritica]